jgi:DNA-binding response OmpR family regulator
MANLFLLDSDGRRRIRLEIAAQRAGHRTGSAGAAEEALRMVPIYVPDAILLADDLPDNTAAAFIQSLRASERELLKRMLVVTPVEAAANGGDPRVVKATSAQPDAMLAAFEETRRES